MPFVSNGPHVLNSSTFSSIITLGFTVAAHRTATHAKPLMFFSTGLPPLALLKCLQSGLNQQSATGLPPVTVNGFISQTDSQ
ncbi:hypothetical protein SDC9_82114 [bioreactor metagenome]|uniref:Uncharacterized protein n=1 Tax=bioreactor metagenome TaxID=1076179 RepID=A0A644Z690_9ZZZZ